MEAVVEKVRSLMSGVKVPQHYDRVYKDECCFTFDTPFSENGLCVNLKTWLGCAMDMVDLDVTRNGGRGGLYLVQKFKRVPKPEPPEGEKKAEPTKLAIGMSGGFLDEKYEVTREHSLLVVDASGGKETVPLPCIDLPTIVINACDGIIAHQGAQSMEATRSWEDDKELKVSKYAEKLVQQPAVKKISPNPKDWKCEESGDTQNLWLNLSDGHIGSGRKFWDGSGGSNGALNHYNAEKAKGNEFPLVVKLGTITAEGADVYSYAPDEDDMVKDPQLAEHLAHWGIDIMKMKKTEKTLSEMEVDLNSNYDWSRICAGGGTPLVKVRAPGLLGLKNLGNSCYMNSTLQLLLGLPEVKSRYCDEAMQIRKSTTQEPPEDLVGQVAKLTNALNTGRYAPPLKEGEDEEDNLQARVAPHMFKALIGKNHPEFSSGRQQDAAEFVQYFLDQLSRVERTALGSRLETGKSTANMFEFAIEEKLQENGAQARVKYMRNRHNMLPLPVKLDDADNLEEVTASKKPKIEGKEGGATEEVRPVIPFERCLERFAAAEDGISFGGTTVSKSSRVATMPPYLLIQVQRYTLNEQWVPTKLDCRVTMPQVLNLEHLRARGLQPGETELPDSGSSGSGGGGAANAAPAAAAPAPDEMMVAQLVSMLGITENAAKRAALAVSSGDIDMAASWYFEHMEDPDVNAPLPEAGAAVAGGGAAAGGDAVDPDTLAMLTSMGFSEKHVRAALKACGANAERAADWLFSHADSLDADIAALEGSGAAPGPAGSEDYSDGTGEYSLVGFISHIGKHTSHGHYVCHMRRRLDDEWFIFDDQKVAKCADPPTDMGYIYLYRRK
mmetsp:Transcript_45094/g.107193  ORF Transcript_45094/g.107193 Transcript_45094/m.107193 type:complete len:838 (-) Transcript_45094:153-2666(-)